MSSFNMWFILCVVVQTATMILKPKAWAKGRILTRPLWRFRIYAPGWTRLNQYLTLIMVSIPLGVIFSNDFALPLHYIVIIALHLDDWLTGDDDEWKRFKEWAANKVKWKMELPPRPVAD